MEYDSLVYGVLIDTWAFDAFQDSDLKSGIFIEHLLTGQMIGVRGVSCNPADWRSGLEDGIGF